MIGTRSGQSSVTVHAEDRASAAGRCAARARSNVKIDRQNAQAGARSGHSDRIARSLRDGTADFYARASFPFPVTKITPRYRAASRVDPLALAGTVHRLPQIAAPLHVQPEVGLLPKTRARMSAVAAVTVRQSLHDSLTCLG